MRRLTALVLLGVLALTACGGSDEDASDSPSPKTSKRISGQSAG